MGNCFVILKHRRHSRPLPPELIYEVFSFLPLGHSMNILVNVSNVQTLHINGPKVKGRLCQYKMAIRNKKWNINDCGPNMKIFDEGLSVTHISAPTYWHWQCARTEISIHLLECCFLKKYIVAYFEVEILHTSHYPETIGIGFFIKQFPLKHTWKEEECGKNAIEFYYKDGFRVDRIWKDFGIGNDDRQEGFEHGEVVGIGIIHCPANSSMECFFTLNGKLLRKTELPPKFAKLQLFPTVDLTSDGEVIRANFGKEEF